MHETISVPQVGAPSFEPIAVRPKVAARILDVSVAYLYELLARGDLVSYRDGAARKIMVDSLRAYVARRVAEEASGLKKAA